MSHFKERNEKNCLNCSNEVAGRYCQHCGQENVEVKESFWHLVIHLIEDITHFDGKIWVTLKYLLFKPAFLTRQYLIGKRATYLHPIRMYVFISAIFLLFIFSGSSHTEQEKTLINNPIQSDSLYNNENMFVLDFGKSSNQYSTKAAYSAAQAKLPKAQQDNWITTKINNKNIDIQQKYKGNNAEILNAIAEQFQHQFSKILYISLPLFAFFLWLLYYRNKNIYFVDHLIFSIHTYCAFFIILFLSSVADKISVFICNKSIPYLNLITFLLMCWYLYKSLRNQFLQSRIKTVLKFLLLNFLSLLLMSILLIGFIVFSVFNL